MRGQTSWLVKLSEPSECHRKPCQKHKRHGQKRGSLTYRYYIIIQGVKNTLYILKLNNFFMNNFFQTNSSPVENRTDKIYVTCICQKSMVIQLDDPLGL